jgi:hypothetical protein
MQQPRRVFDPGGRAKKIGSRATAAPSTAIGAASQQNAVLITPPIQVIL